jgi:hypothetical protein
MRRVKASLRKPVDSGKAIATAFCDAKLLDLTPCSPLCVNVRLRNSRGRGEELSCEFLFSMSRRVEDYPSGTDRICDAAEILQLARRRICKQDRKISIVAGSDRA